eukprot:1020337-Amphidinium_carterae.1
MAKVNNSTCVARSMTQRVPCSKERQKGNCDKSRRVATLGVAWHAACNEASSIGTCEHARASMSDNSERVWNRKRN